MNSSLAQWLLLIKAGLQLFAAVYLGVIPALLVSRDLRDAGLHSGEIPSFAYPQHEHLTEQIGPWAQKRVAAGSASDLSLHNISGTEWPIFSAVYYLWATESLQAAWEADPNSEHPRPMDYAADAVHATAALVADPNHANWVVQHWGPDYLYQDNLFYRMLLISGLTSFQELSGETTYQDLLADQTQNLMAELDASPHGLLEDYPGQTYPIDILPAIAVIQRASPLVGQDHSQAVARSVRGFSGAALDKDTGLPAYVANSGTGQALGPSRGVGIAYMLIWAPEVWPAVAEDWYGRYEAQYWQQSGLLAGTREFAVNSSWPDWWFDVDAGPVFAGYGTAASAFGLAAARANGRFDQAYPLGTEALAASWPLANGTLLAPRLLSNLSDAPYLGEAALLFVMTRQPVVAEIVLPETLRPPLAVYVLILGYLALGSLGLVLARRNLLRFSKLRASSGSAEGFAHPSRRTT
jgi:hypothetical protein